MRVVGFLLIILYHCFALCDGLTAQINPGDFSVNGFACPKIRITGSDGQFETRPFLTRDRCRNAFTRYNTSFNSANALGRLVQITLDNDGYLVDVQVGEYNRCQSLQMTDQSVHCSYSQNSSVVDQALPAGCQTNMVASVLVCEQGGLPFSVLSICSKGVSATECYSENSASSDSANIQEVNN